METKPVINIKGIREGLLVSAVEGTWDTRKTELLRIVHEQESFFSGAKLCLDIGETLMRVKEITALRDQLSDLKVNLWAILSQSEVTNNNARALGIETSLPSKKETKEPPPEKEEDAGERAVLINRTLRAGYRVEAREHVIVMGDVNPGAEIVSAGNIIVWGKLMGSACAGVEGNPKSIVCALELRPTQLRIGEIVLLPMMRKGKLFPEAAHIENNEVRIELWNKEKGK